MTTHKTYNQVYFSSGSVLTVCKLRVNISLINNHTPTCKKCIELENKQKQLAKQIDKILKGY